MRIVCPKCELKGEVDAAPTGTKSRIACVRCATTFDAIFTDSQIQVQPPQASSVEMSVGNAENNNLPPRPEIAATLETIQETELDDSQQLEASPALEDKRTTASPNLMSSEAEGISPAAAQDEYSQVFAKPSLEDEYSQVFAKPSLEVHAQEEVHGSSQSSIAVAAPLKAIAVAAPLKANDAGKLSRPSSDAYGLGVRLMQISPAWLLLAGLSFISFIVLYNWLIGPVEQTGDAASQIAAANNRATNQSINRVAVSNSTAQPPVNNQIVQPMTESGVAFIGAEAKESPARQATPGIEMNKEKSDVGEKPAMPESSRSSSGETKDRKVTIQIGSYNEAAQAEERVVKLKSAGFEARSVAAEIPNRGTWYRVQSGRFINRDEAERYGKQLRDKGIVSNFITTDIQE